MPPPMQSVARPFLALRRDISCNSVVSTRAPEAPIGWPSAMAPPLTLTIAGSQPRSLLTARACAAKASFASTSSRSLTDQPAFSGPFGFPGAAPGPWSAGSRPPAPRDRPGAHDRRIDARRRPGHDARQRRQPSALRFGGVHDDQRGGAVVETGSVGRGYGSVLGKGGLEFRHRLVGRAMARIFVGVDNDVALARRYSHRRNLVLEPAGLLRRLGLVLRADGEPVLVLAADLPLSRDILCGVAHVIAVKGVDEAILQHGVDEFHLSHFDAAPQIGGVGGKRHRFLAARDDDLGVAAGDLLHAERDRAQTAAAKLIDTESRLLLGNASLHRRLARRILTLRRGEDLPENHLVHVARVDLGGFESALDGDRAQIMRGGRAEGAVERPHWGTFCAGDDNLRGGHVGLPLE